MLFRSIKIILTHVTSAFSHLSRRTKTLSRKFPAPHPVRVSYKHAVEQGRMHQVIIVLPLIKVENEKKLKQNHLGYSSCKYDALIRTKAWPSGSSRCSPVQRTCSPPTSTLPWAGARTVCATGTSSRHGIPRPTR